MTPWTHARIAEAQCELLRKLCDEKDNRIADLQAHVVLLEKQSVELKALFSKTSQFEIVEQDADTVRLRAKPLQSGSGSRSGWRSKRAASEAQTHSTVNDSVAALEKRAEGDN